MKYTTAYTSNLIFYQGTQPLHLRSSACASKVILHTNLFEACNKLTIDIKYFFRLFIYYWIIFCIQDAFAIVYKIPIVARWAWPRARLYTRYHIVAREQRYLVYKERAHAKLYCIQPCCYTLPAARALKWGCNVYQIQPLLDLNAARPSARDDCVYCIQGNIVLH